MADGSIIIDTLVDSSGAEKGLKSLSGMADGALKSLTKATKVMATGIAVATGVVAGLTKASIQQYAEFEQLTGGVETLFKTSSDKVMEYANNAYMTAGLSANEYMSTITGFSASLLQGLGGDTVKAAEVGNQAVTDMADNANKMGTSMESIQNAYQGFAKQNYTMLDNLKLGYGGTKTEMERLLADASKISGVKYDISNFSDVIEAIHTIQNEMGITGTTTKEAMSTIEGSFNMTKSAWSNLLTGMANDNADFDKLIDNFVDSAGAFGENILPRIQIALNGVSELITQLAPIIAAKLPELVTNILPQLITAGINIINSLTIGIQQNLPNLANSTVQILTSITTSLLNLLPQVLTIGMQAIAYLAEGIGQQSPTLIPVAIACVTSLIQGFISNMPLILNAGLDLLNGIAEGIINAIPVFIEVLPKIIQGIIDFFTSETPNILQVGLDIILALINGIVEELPQLIAMLPQIINSIVTFVTTNLPQIIDIGIQVLLALIDGLVQALPQLIAMQPQIINAIITGLLAHLPELINAGIQIIVALATGLLQAIPQLVGAIPQIISAIWNAFININWGEIGSNILTGIGAGIKGAITGMVQVGIEACKTLKDSIKAFFDIHSPSRVMRDEVGKMLTAGIGVGITQGLTSLLTTAKNVCSILNSTIKKELNANIAQEYINSIYNASGDFSNITKGIKEAQKMLDEANSMKVVDDITDREKEEAQKQIDIAKESAQKQLDIANEKKDKLIALATATGEAIKNKLTEEKTTALDKIQSEMDAEEEAYNKKIANIESATKKKKSTIQSEIDAIDQEKEAESRLQEIQESNNNIAVLQAKMNNIASEADKKAYALKIKNAQNALEAKKAEWDREDEKAALKEEQDEIEERANRKKERLKEEYEGEKENLEKKKQATEDYYSKLLDTDSLNAQTRYMMLQGSNDQLVELLQSYNPLWQNAGQSLADSLINGLNSKQQDMASAISEMTSLRGYDETIQLKEFKGKGYASGTSYNPIEGLYKTNEKGFELSSNDGDVAYVSKGAGILSHMQSMGYIKQEIGKQVGTFANKLRNAVMIDQYRMGQLAMANATNSYGGNVDNSTSYGGHLLNVEHMEIRNESDIESLAHELESYKQKKKR